MIERLENISQRYLAISAELMDPENINEFNKIKTLSKEQKSLEEVYEAYQAYKKILFAIEETKEMGKDVEYASIAMGELEILKGQEEELQSQLEILLIPKDENDGKNVIMEIRGAAGGDEANIFAGDLFRMYTKYAEKNNWHIEVINGIEGTSGGFSQIEMIIKGDSVYAKLKFESGAHRVQRVPETETQGRVHTSTATVVVMPEMEDIDVEVLEKDLKIDVFHSSGAGGQSVNTADSAVRITHLPTGVVVSCQNERSQLKNKEKALQILRSKIYDAERMKQQEMIESNRKNQVGTGDRSEKIRTYNYPQNRITDHRINFSLMELDRVMDGDLEAVIEALITADQQLKLEGHNSLND